MITKIQTYFSYFLTKLTALALLLFILTSFNLQIITANAQPATTPPKPATTDVKPTTNTGTTKNPNILTQKQVDDRIGTLKNCSVNSSNEGKLKEDPTYANTFILNCLKDIIQIVITISVILAIMRLIFVGIKFLNTFEDEGKLQGELAKAITGFVAGAVILGLFAAIINVVNPSALRIDKIFSAQVIADYKCLNKGIGDNVKGAEVEGKNCSDVKQGTGLSKSDTSKSIKTLVDNPNPTEEQKKEIERIKEQTQKCIDSAVFTSSTDANNCKPYLEVLANDSKLSETLKSSVDSALLPSYNTDVFAGGTYRVITNDDVNVTVTYIQTGTTKEQKFTLFYNDDCKKTPFDKEIKQILPGGQLNFAPCILQITKDK
jgi:hypothetical protein